MDEKIIGPLLTDGELYDALDTDRYPEYKACKVALEKGEAAKARKIFADNARCIFDVDRFYSLPNKCKKPELTNSLKGTAERSLNHLMSSCGIQMQFGEKVDWFANPAHDNLREWPWQLSRHGELVALANAYRASGDERYAYGCAELLDSWIKQAVRPEIGEGSGATICWRTIECGIRMGLQWPTIIHTFAQTEAFTDDLIVDYFKSVYEHSIRMITSFTSGNWLMHELNGLGLNGIFYPIFRDSDYWYNISIEKMEKELREKQVYADGFQFETSTGYHIVVIRHVTELVEVAVAYGKTVPQSMYNVLENMLMLCVKLVQADGIMPHPNDTGAGKAKVVIKEYGHLFPENPHFKWLLSDGVDGEKPPFNSILLENCGHIALRRDFDSGVSAYFDAGVLGAGHQHEDKLNLTISNKVKPILCEAKTYAYDTSAMRAYCLDSLGHNVIRVNGMGQNRRSGYKFDYSSLTKKEENVTLEITPEYDIAMGIYDEGYGRNQERAAKQERKVIMLKNPKKGLPIFIAIDTMISENENEYEALWHYDSSGARIEDGKFVCDDMTQFVLGDVGNMDIICGQREPFVQGWVLPVHRQDIEVPIPTLVHKYNGANTMTVNIFAMHENGVCPITGAMIEGENVIITYASGEKDSIKI